MLNCLLIKGKESKTTVVPVHTIRGYRELEIYLHPFLTWALDADEFSC
jgi:hypothetical protein